VIPNPTSFAKTQFVANAVLDKMNRKSNRSPVTFFFIIHTSLPVIFSAKSMALAIL